MASSAGLPPVAGCRSPPLALVSLPPQHALHAHPGFTVLYPLLGVSTLALLLPLLLFLSFRAEFAGLHPAWPPHYAFLARRMLRALAANSAQLKVGGRCGRGAGRG